MTDPKPLNELEVQAWRDDGEDRPPRWWAWMDVCVGACMCISIFLLASLTVALFTN